MNPSEYKGWREVELSDTEIAYLYQHQNLNSLEDIKQNTYLIVKDKNGKIVDKFIKTQNKIEQVRWRSIHHNFGDIVKPRNIQQELGLNLLQNLGISLKLLLGVYGSGKDFLMINQALEFLEKDQFQKIIWVRNNISVKDTGVIGSLPGDSLEKIMPWLMPVADIMGGYEGLEELLDKDMIEAVPLGFIRGRSFQNSIIMCSEAENLTKEQIQLLIGRVGDKSQLWLNGDLRQRDLQVFEKSQGIEILIERLTGNPLFGNVYLPKTERSQTAALADLLD